jgi:hypothetical protein
MTSKTTDKPADFGENVLHPEEMKPSEFTLLIGRPVPEWLNIDVLITPEEVAEVENVRRDMQDFVRAAIKIGKRVRWAQSLSNRFDCPVDDAFTIFTNAIGTEAISGMGDVLGLLFGDAFSHDQAEAMAASIEEAMPDVAEAIRLLRLENPTKAPERGSFTAPRDEGVADQ